MPVRPTIRFEPEGAVENLLRKVRGLQDENRVQRRALARAKRDISRLYLRHLKRNIRRATVRRTGALLAARVTARLHPSDPVLIVHPHFPRTAFSTSGARGRRGARKRGQYAFVLNATPGDRPRHFIQMTVADLRADPELAAILLKHLSFIIEQILKGNRNER